MFSAKARIETFIYKMSKDVMLFHETTRTIWTFEKISQAATFSKTHIVEIKLSRKARRFATNRSSVGNTINSNGNAIIKPPITAMANG